MPTAPKSKKSTPGYSDLIQEAIVSLKERNGSSRHAIDQIVSSKKGLTYTKSRLNATLRKDVDSGKLIQVKGSYKVPSSMKKKAPTSAVASTKKTVAKKAPGKKTATKKSVAKKPASKAGAKKKPVAKKSTVKKNTVKKNTVKKASTKKSPKKKPTKKGTAKK